MQKALLTCFCALLSFYALAQQAAPPPPVTEFPIKEDKLYYEGVVTVDPASKQADLYRTGRTWFVDTYVDAKEVLQLDDKADGKLMGKGLYKYAFLNGINVSQILMRFTLSLDVKDGKYRYRIYNFTGDNVNTSMLGGANATNVYRVNFDQCYLDYKAGKRTKYNLKVLQGMDTQVQLIVASLNKAMTAAKAGKDDF